jgi:hypothetical protein
MFQFSSFFMLLKKILFFLSTSRSFFCPRSLICMIHEHKCVPSVDKDVVGWKKEEKSLLSLCASLFYSFQQFFPPFLRSMLCVFFFDIASKKKRTGSEKAIWWGWKLMWYSIFFLYATLLQREKASPRLLRENICYRIWQDISLARIEYFSHFLKATNILPQFSLLCIYRQHGDWKKMFRLAYTGRLSVNFVEYFLK